MKAKEALTYPNIFLLLIMVTLQFRLPLPTTNTAKLPSISLSRSSGKPPSAMHCKTPTSLFISNSNERPGMDYLPVCQSVAAIVFGDVSESRLYPLTKRRSQGAVPVAGNYRLIDVVVSNCINSHITKIYTLTQFNSTSLNSHLSRAYSGIGLGKEGLVEVIAAYQSLEDKGWFQGDADAIRRCLWVLEEHPVTEFIILPGHHLYKMDYQNLIERHKNSGADITVVGSSAPRNGDAGFGFLKVNSENQVLELREAEEWQLPDASNKDGTYSFQSMGIYVIKRDAMRKLLTESFPKAIEFVREVIPGAISLGMKVHSFIFDGYWEDMRNIEAFYQANMESTKKVTSGFNFYDRDSPVYTLPRCLPPTIIRDAEIMDSTVGEGCILNKCRIKDSVIGIRTRIGDRAVIEESVIMGADAYQRDGLERRGTAMDIPLGIGEASYLKKVIVDKNARIGKNVRIINKDNVQEGSREGCGYVISGGIVILLKNAVIPDGSIL